MLDPRDMSRARDADARDRAYEGRERSDDPRDGLLTTSTCRSAASGKSCWSATASTS